MVTKSKPDIARIVGLVLSFAAIVFASGGAYFAIQDHGDSIDKHDVRISVVEKSCADAALDRKQFQAEIRNELKHINSNVSSMSSDMQTLTKHFMRNNDR